MADGGGPRGRGGALRGASSPGSPLTHEMPDPFRNFDGNFDSDSAKLLPGSFFFFMDMDVKLF